MSSTTLSRVETPRNVGMTIRDFIVRALPSDWDNLQELEREVDFREVRGRDEAFYVPRISCAGYRIWKDARETLFHTAAVMLSTDAHKYVISGTPARRFRPVTIDLISADNVRILNLKVSSLSVNYKDVSRVFYDVRIQQLPPSQPPALEAGSVNRRKRAMYSPVAKAVADALGEIGLKDDPGGLKYKEIARRITGKLKNQSSFGATYQAVCRHYAGKK